jgi:hypothetical protein
MFGELIGLLFGQIAAESTKDPEKRGSTFLDGKEDALSGVASAILGSFGLLLGLSSLWLIDSADTITGFFAIVIIAILGFGCSYFGSYFGRRAPHVTNRFLGVARYAAVISSVGAIVCVASPLVAAAKIFL